jgi:hypothetical protein
MVIEVKNGEWVLCRGQAIHVTEEEIARALRQGQSHKYKGKQKARSRAHIVDNIALGKRIGTYREWPRTKDEEA